MSYAQIVNETMWHSDIFAKWLQEPDWEDVIDFEFEDEVDEGLLLVLLFEDGEEVPAKLLPKLKLRPAHLQAVPPESLSAPKFGLTLS